jgi:hypothetical protein
MRQRDLALESTLQELDEARASIRALPPPQGEQLIQQLDLLQEQLISLVATAQAYGRLKYETKVSKQLEIFR